MKSVVSFKYDSCFCVISCNSESTKLEIIIMLTRAATTRNDWSAADWYFLMDFCQPVKFWYAFLVKADC